MKIVTRVLQYLKDCLLVFFHPYVSVFCGCHLLKVSEKKAFVQNFTKMRSELETLLNGAELEMLAVSNYKIISRFAHTV